MAASPFPSDMTDLQLIEACLRQERSAQYELVRRYGPRLLTVCRRFTPAGHAAEDSLQDAFVLVFRHLERFDPGKGELWPWMKTVTIRETLKKYRRQALWTLPIEDPVLEALQDGAPDPRELQDLGAEEILQLIARLPEGYSEVFNLVAIEGYTHEECAALLGISAGTSRSTLSRARRILQLQYQKQSLP